MIEILSDVIKKIKKTLIWMPKLHINVSFQVSVSIN